MGKDKDAESDPVVQDDNIRGLTELSVLSNETRALAHPAVELAASNLVVTERARIDIVENQLLQFVEILSIKIRRRVMLLRARAEIIRNQIGTVSFQQPSGTGISTPNLGSAFGILRMLSTLGPYWATGIGIGGSLYFSLFGPRLAEMAKTGVAVFSVTKGYDYVQKFQLKRSLNTLNNFLNAFGENGDDELESERIVRHIAKNLGLRHLNQICRLSKNGQETLASVMVDRITQNLLRHPYGYQHESRSWIINEIQHKIWEAEIVFESLTKPADRVRTRETLTLLERCIRALTNEIVPFDDRPVELEHYLNDGSPPANERWTASGVLSKCGVCVRLENNQTELYSHSQSETEKYGFCYGSIDEVRARRMKIQTELFRSKL